MKRNNKVKAGDVVVFRGTSRVVKLVFKCIAVLVVPGSPDITEAAHVNELTAFGPCIG